MKYKHTHIHTHTHRLHLGDCGNHARSLGVPYLWHLKCSCLYLRHVSLHRLCHLSSPTLSKDEFFNDLQMNHSGRIVREAEPSPFLKTKREIVPSTEKAWRMSEMKAVLQLVKDAVKHICFKDAAYWKVHCRASENRKSLSVQPPNNESSSSSVHTLFVVIFFLQQQLFSSSWLH